MSGMRGMRGARGERCTSGLFARGACLTLLAVVLGLTVACAPGETAADAGHAGYADAGGNTRATCGPACAAAADCVPDGADASNDVDNWACTDRACVYTGCHAGECASGAVCTARASDRVPTCKVRCTLDGACPDTFTAGGPLTCVAGVCESHGCENDAQCAAGLGMPDAVCADVPRVPGEPARRACAAGCGTDADCPADAPACTAGVCRAQTCTDDAECAAGQACATR